MVLKNQNSNVQQTYNSFENLLKEDLSEVGGDFVYCFAGVELLFLRKS
jgi:hypothetical protein